MLKMSTGAPRTSQMNIQKVHPRSRRGQIHVPERVQNAFIAPDSIAGVLLSECYNAGQAFPDNLVCFT